MIVWHVCGLFNHFCSIRAFAWAGTVVIATWPVLLRLQIMFGRRSLAVPVMTLLLVMVFIIPIALLVNSIVRRQRPAN